MAKWEIIEDNKFKKGNGGKSTASRAVTTKRTAVKAAATPNNLTIITPEQKEKAQADYDEAYKWTSDYMNSPMYKKMLTESSANTREFDNIDKTRWSNFKSIPPLQILPQPRNEPNTGGTSLGFNGQVQLFPYGFGAKAIYSHELSHSTDRPVEESDSRIIPQSDKNYISQHVPTTFEDSPMYATNKSFYDLFKKNKPKEYKKEAKDYKKFHINYVGQDTETRARLNAIRQGAQQNNLYDPFKEGVTPELYYDKLKNFKFEKEDKSGADPMYQLKNVYSDEEIIYMLNHISENKKENNGTELDNLPKAEKGLTIKTPFSNLTSTQPVQEKSVIKSIPTTVKPQYKSEGDYLNQVYGEDSGVQLPGQSSTLRASQDAKPAYDVAKQDYSSYNKYIEEQKTDEQVAKFLKANPLPESKSDKADYIENLSPYDRQLIQSSSSSNQFLPAFRQYQNRVGENAKKYSLKETFSDPDKASEVAQLGLNRFRFFPNATNSIEDFVNPGIWLGQMEQGVADIPKNIRDENYLGAAMGVVNPMLLGRTMGSGSINPLGKKFWTNEVSTPQFINNLVNPLASVVENPLVNYAENNRFLPNINEIKQFSGIFKKPALPEFISNTEQELLHANRNIGKQIKEGILDIQDDVSAKEAIKFLNNVKDKSNLLTDDQFLRATGFEKNQIANKIQEVLKKQEALKNIQSQKKNYTVLGEDEETIDLSRRFNLQRNSRANLRSYNLNNTLNNTLDNVNLNNYLTTPTEKPFVFKNFLEKLTSQPQVVDRGIIDHSLKPSLSAGKGVNPTKEIIKAVNEVRALDKGVTVNSAQSLSSDSKIAELRMLEKLLEEDAVSVNYHGMKDLNSMGFSQRTGIPSILNLKEINTYIHNVNQLLPKNKKIPFATITENGQIWYPDISATRKKYGGVIEDPMGQWAHPGSVTRIPSNQITMQGVNYPVLGVSDRGHTQMMYPGEDYSFRGKSVTEYPMMGSGGATYAELKNQILNTRLPATNRPTLNPNFNRSTSTTSPLSLQALGKQDYGVSLNKNGLNLSAGLNLEGKNPAFRAGVDYGKGNWSGSANYSTDNNNFGTQVGYNNKGFNAGAGYQRNNDNNSFNTNAGYSNSGFNVGAGYQRNNNNNSFNANVGYDGDSPVNFNANYAYDKDHSFDTNVGLNLGRFSGGLNYGYNQEGDRAHNFGANANLGLGKNLNVNADANFDSNKNYQVNAGLKYNFQDGGEVNFTYAGENHRVYEKESPTGNGKGIEGHIMVNHPTENKKRWDTIDLTKITNGRVKTVPQGVASTKKWHKENPEYANGGKISSWEIIEDVPKAGNGLISEITSTLNPKNWGVNDYTKSGTRDQAYAAARKAGEKEFMWNNERFSTKKDTDPIKYIGTNPNQKEFDETLRNDYPEFFKTLNRGKNVGAISFKGVHETQPNRGFIIPYKTNSMISVGENPEDSKDFMGTMIAESSHLKDPKLYRSPLNPYYLKARLERLLHDEEVYKIPDNLEYNDHRLFEPGMALTAYGDLSPEDIKRIQASLGEEQDGYFGPKTYKALQNQYKDNYNVTNALITHAAIYNDNDKNPISMGKDDNLSKAYLTAINNNVPLKHPEKFINPTSSINVGYSDYALKSNAIENMDPKILQSSLYNRGYDLPKSVNSFFEFDGVVGDETKQAYNDWKQKAMKTSMLSASNNYEPQDNTKVAPPIINKAVIAPKMAAQKPGQSVALPAEFKKGGKTKKSSWQIIEY